MLGTVPPTPQMLFTNILPQSLSADPFLTQIAMPVCFENFNLISLTTVLKVKKAYEKRRNECTKFIIERMNRSYQFESLLGTFLDLYLKSWSVKLGGSVGKTTQEAGGQPVSPVVTRWDLSLEKKKLVNNR